MFLPPISWVREALPSMALSAHSWGSRVQTSLQIKQKSQSRTASSEYTILMPSLLALSGRHDILGHLRCWTTTSKCKRRQYALLGWYCYQRPPTMGGDSLSRVAPLKYYEWMRTNPRWDWPNFPLWIAKTLTASLLSIVPFVVAGSSRNYQSNLLTKSQIWAE